MEKTIIVGDKEVRLKTNAGLLRRYRTWFGRDIVTDVNKISKALTEALGDDDEEVFSNLPVEVLTIFEDISYAMNKYAEPEITDDIDEWLDGFDTFDIYAIFPLILEMWEADNQTTTTAKKKNAQPSAK